jgi:flagellar basal body rod protein FlgC
MIEAGREEAKIAIESGNVDENNVPLIIVIADGTWCKRSYRTNYNAKLGATCIVGEKTGTIFFLGNT